MTASENVREFPQQPGSFLCQIALVRRPDGTIAAVLNDMPASLIESTGEDVSSRAQIIAGWLHDGAADMLQQAEAMRHG